jgi:predicted RNA binding protein YcfA (HicA-like mRNA interferase family)
MPKLYSSKDIVRVLEQHGFSFVSQKGSHAKFRKQGQPTLTVIVPMNKRQIPFGTFRSIMRQSLLSGDDFEG